MTVAHKTISFTATGGSIVINRPCVFYGYIVGMDGTNDPTITIYDNSNAASGHEPVPTNTYDASVLGVNGAMLPADGTRCRNGLYCYTTIGAGAVEITIYYN